MDFIVGWIYSLPTFHTSVSLIAQFLLDRGQMPEIYSFIHENNGVDLSIQYARRIKNERIMFL